MNASFDENTIKEFVAENRDHLEEIEPDLLTLERSGNDTPPEIINRVFRAIHSIKGSSGFFSFSAIKELSHVMEGVLVGIREGTIPSDSAGIDALLAGVDKLRIMFADVEKCDKVPYEEELRRLNGVLSDSGAKPPLSPPSPAESAPAEPRAMVALSQNQGRQILTVSPPEGGDLSPSSFDLDASQSLLTALEDGAYLYAVWHPGHDDSKAGGPLADLMGDYGVYAFDRRSRDGSLPTASLFATVMEPDLLCEVLGIPGDRVMRLDPGVLRSAPTLPSEPERLTKPEETGSTPSSSPSDPTPPAPMNREERRFETIRVRVDIIDMLMNLAGELVLGRNQLRMELSEAVRNDPKLGTLIQSVDMVTSEVQEKIVQIRMQPMSNLFTKFTRVVRDLSHQLDKEVELVLEGREVELDKSILEGLSDPMTHLLRNSLDHGIEEPGIREASGKPNKGTIRLRAFHEGGQVSITVTDDGKGIDPDMVAKTAVSKGILSAEAAGRMSEREKLNLILTPGFSTAKTVSEISGRGVGMDVVRTNIEKLGGHLDIQSEKGVSTTFRIRLPLTLAIIPSLIVGAGGHRFAVPQVNVKELVSIHAEDLATRIEVVADAEVLRLRERLLPLVRLTDVLGLPRIFIDPSSGERREDRRGALLDRRSHGSGVPSSGQREVQGERRVRRERRQSWHSDLYVVVLRLGENRFGLCVDELFDTEEIVVKPLSRHIKNVKCFSGATIMGDGRVAMILDAAGIASFQRLRFNEIGHEERRRCEKETARNEAESLNRRAVLLFNNAPEESFALPLESVSRLEKVDLRRIHRRGPYEFMDYQGAGLPLFRLESFLPVTPLPKKAEEMFVIIPKTRQSSAGILVSQILDTLETNVPLRQEGMREPCLLGSAFLEGRLTFFLDADELVSRVEKEYHPQEPFDVPGAA